MNLLTVTTVAKY